MYYIGSEGAQQNYRNGATHHLNTALLERREESRAHLQADRVDEEYQSELLDEVQRIMVDGHAEVTRGNADKKNPCNAERNARNFHLAQHNSERYNQRQNKHRVRNAVTHKK